MGKVEIDNLFCLNGGYSDFFSYMLFEKFSLFCIHFCPKSLDLFGCQGDKKGTIVTDDFLEFLLLAVLISTTH